MAAEGDNSGAFERLCRRCGGCCYKKYILNGTVFVTTVPCRYFDERTKLCTIYPNRHRINSRCLDVPHGIDLGVFPADCPYVKDVPEYVPPFEISLDEDAVRFIEVGMVTDAEDLKAYLRKREGGTIKGG